MARIFVFVFFLLAACAESIPEIAHYNGQSVTIQLRATPANEWELLIDNDIVVKQKVEPFSTNETLRGTYKGKPVMVRRYFRSNGWTQAHVADVFIGGQLIETLVIQ